MHKKFLRTSAVILMCASSCTTVAEAMEDEEPLLNPLCRKTQTYHKYSDFLNYRESEVGELLQCQYEKVETWHQPKYSNHTEERRYIEAVGWQVHNRVDYVTVYDTTPARWKTTFKCKNCDAVVKHKPAPFHPRLTIRNPDKRKTISVYQTQHSVNLWGLWYGPCPKPKLTSPLKEIWDNKLTMTRREKWTELYTNLGNSAVALDKKNGISTIDRWVAISSPNWCEENCCSIL